MAGKYHDQFLVDWYQGGAGTSANMNANEVLANIGLELTGHKKGEYQFLEPHDDLNMSQSTNDSYPTAIKVAFILRNDKLIAELQQLVASFRAKGNEYLEIPKMGRTELQDAVPMTVGQEFHAFAASLESEIQLLRDAEKYLYAVNMGATAIGTRHQRAEGLPRGVAAELAKLTEQADRAGEGHVRGHVGSAGLRRLLLGAQEPRDQAVEDRERPDPARLRAARRPRRDQSAGDAAGLVDHAGQGQPGDSRAHQRHRVPRDGQRRRRRHRRALRAAAAQRLRAARRALRSWSRSSCCSTARSTLRTQVRRRHHGQREGARRATWRPRSASSPRSIRCSATRRRPSSRTRPTRAARACSRSSARRRC